MTFTAYIWAFESLKLVLIYRSDRKYDWRWSCVYFGFPQVVFTTEIEEMDVFALKAHPLHDKKGCDLSKKSFLCLYV